jgi:uncharacterized protein YndB with AHSA1/START domain
MKLFVKTLLTIFSLIVLLLLVGLFLKKDYAVAREIVINKPVDQVFDYIRYLENQDQYSAWAEMDPNQEITYTGTDGEVGFVSAWKGEVTGEGAQEITRIQENSRIETKLRFIKPFKAENDVYMEVEAIGENQTLLRWGFSGRSPWPLNLMTLFFNIEKGVGADYDKGLQKLKGILEAA